MIKGHKYVADTFQLPKNTKQKMSSLRNIINQSSFESKFVTTPSEQDDQLKNKDKKKGAK